MFVDSRPDSVSLSDYKLGRIITPYELFTLSCLNELAIIFQGHSGIGELKTESGLFSWTKLLILTPTENGVVID